MHARPLSAACCALAAFALAASGCGAGERAAASVPFRAQVRHAIVGGARIAYYVRGRGPALLMNMGSGSTMAEWDPALLRDLAARHRLILWDYPGFGLSQPDPKAQRTMGALADRAAGLLRALHVRRAAVLGWSLGGFVAQQLAIRHPGTVSAIVLAGTNPGGSAAVLGPEWAQQADSEQGLSDAQALRVLFPPGPAGRRAGAAFLGRVEAAADSGDIPDDFTVPAGAYQAQLDAEERWMGSGENLAGLRRLRMPALVAGGGRDVLTPPANDRILAAAIAGARRIAFPSGGHAFLFQFHSQFARQAGAFLERSGWPAGSRAGSPAG